MLYRRYSDGVVVFDPSDGRTFSIPRDAFDIVELIGAQIDAGTRDADELVAQALAELGADDGAPADDRARHLRQWVDLALRLRGD